MEICLLFSKHLRSVPPPPSFLCSCAPLSVLIPFWHLYLCLFGGRCHRVPFGCWLCLQPKTHSQRGFNNQKENCINIDFGVGVWRRRRSRKSKHHALFVIFQLNYLAAAASRSLVSRHPYTEKEHMERLNVNSVLVLIIFTISNLSMRFNAFTIHHTARV